MSFPSMCSTSVIRPAPRLTRMLALCALVLLSAAPLAAQEQADSAKKDGKPDLGPMRTIEFDVEEGTWMSIDVAPDGRTLLFDLLGDLYTVPIG